MLHLSSHSELISYLDGMQGKHTLPKWSPTLMQEQSYALPPSVASSNWQPPTSHPKFNNIKSSFHPGTLLLPPPPHTHSILGQISSNLEGFPVLSRELPSDY